jgi:hypothetical protein
MNYCIVAMEINLFVHIQFTCRIDVSLVFTFICFEGIHVLFMLFVFIYVYWYGTRFPYQMMFMSFKSSMTGATVYKRQ